VTKLYRRVPDEAASVETVRLVLNNETALFDFLTEMLPLIEPCDWKPVFQRFKAGDTLAISGSGSTVAIKAGNNVDKEFLWKSAEEQVMSKSPRKLS